MKACKHAVYKKSGGVLIMVMLVMLLISVLAIGLFKLSDADAVETVYMKQSKQAFWLAEAGLQDAIQQLNWLQSYRDAPVAFSNSYGTGSYAVNISNIEAHSAVIEGTNYTIISTGYVRGQNRRVQQIVTTFPGSKFAIIGNTGSSSFNSNAEIHGSIIQFEGSVDTGNNDGVVVDDYIFADTVTGGGDYTQAPVPLIDSPSLDTAIYTDQINAITKNESAPNLSSGISSISANTNFDANVTFNNSSLSIDSGVIIQSTGDMVFDRAPTFNGPVTILAGGSITFVRSIDPLPDGSTVIARGDISIRQQTTLETNVKIYSGNDVIIGQQAYIGGGTIIYADRDLIIASGGGNTIDDTGVGIALLANRNLTINSNMNPFKGIMFSNTGTVTLNANIDVYGTVIGGVGFTADSNVDFFYDPSVFSWPLGVVGIDIGDAILTKGIWQELPSL